MLERRRAKEIEINFGPARVFVQYGSVDAVTEVNHPNLRGENDETHAIDEALLQWSEDQLQDVPVANHPYDVNIRIDFESKSSREERLAIVGLISRNVIPRVPNMLFATLSSDDARAEEIVNLTQTGLINKEQCRTIAKASVEGVMEAREQWWAAQREQDPQIARRATVATILDKFSTKISALKRLRAEEIIVEKLEPAISATERAKASPGNMAKGLAFYLNNAQREVDRLTVQLGSVGISERLSSDITRQVCENIFPARA